MRNVRLRFGGPLFIAAFAVGSAATAQTYSFRVYGPEDGLSTLAVTCMAQDGKGFMWVGSLNGLYRYNGERFERIGEAFGLTGNRVVSLAAAPNGDLWAATEAGIALWRDGRFHPVRLDAAVMLRSPSSLAIETATGSLWAATSKGVFRIQESGTAAFATLERRFPAGDYNAVAFGPEGSIWAERGNSVVRWKANRLTQGAQLGVPRENWGAVMVDREGSVWIRSVSRLMSLAPGAGRFVSQDDGLPDAEIISLGLGRSGEILVPTIFGLARRAEGKWQVIGRRQGLPMSSVSSVLVDRDGSPWIGTSGGGAARWVGFNAWEAWTAPDWMEDDAVWAIAEDHRRAIWIGTNNGLLRLPPDYESRNIAPERMFALHMPVHTLATGSRDELWVGTNHKGLFRCETTAPSCRPYGAASGLAARDIDKALIDSEGVLWVRTATGLFASRLRSRPIRFSKIQLPGLAGTDSVPRVALLPSGRVVLALGNTLWTPAPPGWRATRLGGLLDPQIDQLIADQGGVLWLTYLNNVGVTAVRSAFSTKPSLQHYKVCSGLRSNLIYALATDKTGRIFVGTDRGIDMREQGKWRHYQTSEGLIWNDINTAAMLADSRGGIWIGTSRGLAHFQPEQEYRSPLRPVPVITSVQIQGRDQDLLRSMEVPYRSRDVTVRFSALSFAHESGMRFRYRLLGLSDAWTSSDDRNIRLIGLPSGSYTLELDARNSNGLASGKPARLRLTVETPWWRTRLFYSSLAFALLALARIAWLWRMRMLLSRHRDLERLVQERTRALVIEQQRLLDAREALRDQATRDPLTGLLNRRAMFDALERQSAQAVREGRHMALVMADVDHFKSINDRFGHQAGDNVLMELGVRFASAVRPYDAVGRYGGEELIMMFIDCTGAEATKRAEELRRTIESHPVVAGTEELRVTCSFGVSAAVGDQIKIDGLIAAADYALYQAKREGRNCVMWWNPSDMRDGSLNFEQSPVALS